MSAEPPANPTEEELRAAWEEQLRTLTPADLIVQCAASLINLGGRRLGLDRAGGDRDLDQARDAIDGVRALLPVLERREGPETLRPLREALSALQLEYAKLAGAAAPPPGERSGGTPASEPEPAPGEHGPGPAQRSGRLWIPGS